MPKKCYKEAERACNDDCAAYIDSQDGTSCLQLATQAEIANQLKGYRLSQDSNTFYVKVLTDTMGPLGGSLDDLKRMLSA